MKWAGCSRTVRIGVLLCQVGFLAFASGGDLSGSSGEPAAEKGQKRKVRVGTYNSRAVALAYYRSKEFERWLEELRAERAPGWLALGP